jgi:hypothetical protein
MEAAALPMRRAGHIRGQQARLSRLLLHAASAGGCARTTSEGEMMPEGGAAGSVGEVGPIGDEWAFTLFDNTGRELLAFVFTEEGEARRAAKAMQEILAGVAALAPAQGTQSSFFSVPTRRA